MWKAEKSAVCSLIITLELMLTCQNDERKKLNQLRKEQEEERQLQDLQRMQEAATGKKRVERLDWMYAAPGNEGGALGGARIGERDMEDYLLGKKRVDEVLAQGDKNVRSCPNMPQMVAHAQIGDMSKDFIALQNANSARDTASKIREDPLLAIKRQELAAIEALRNRPEIRRKLKEMQKAKEGGKDDKEARRAKRHAEKEVSSSTGFSTRADELGAATRATTRRPAVSTTGFALSKI